MPKTYPHLSASSAPTSYEARPEDGAVSLEELNRRAGGSPVAQLFADPPSWLANQTKVYQRSPATDAQGREKRLVKPLSHAVATHLELEASEIREEVDEALKRWSL